MTSTCYVSSWSQGTSEFIRIFIQIEQRCEPPSKTLYLLVLTCEVCTCSKLKQSALWHRAFLAAMCSQTVARSLQNKLGCSHRAPFDQSVNLLLASAPGHVHAEPTHSACLRLFV